MGIFIFIFLFFSEKNTVCRDRTHVPTCQRLHGTSELLIIRENYCVTVYMWRTEHHQQQLIILQYIINQVIIMYDKNVFEPYWWESTIKYRGVLGCGSFVRGRKRKNVDSRPFILTSERHAGETSWGLSPHQYQPPSIPIISISKPFYQMTVQRREPSIPNSPPVPMLISKHKVQYIQNTQQTVMRYQPFRCNCYKTTQNADPLSAQTPIPSCLHQADISC